MTTPRNTEETTAKNGRTTTDSDDKGQDGANISSIDEQKGRAANALRDVATTLRERAGSAPLPGMDAAAEAAARPLESGARYIEEHSPGDMWSDLMSFCSDHPAGALAIGFMTGYLFKKLFR